MSEDIRWFSVEDKIDRITVAGRADGTPLTPGHRGKNPLTPAIRGLEPDLLAK